MKYKKTFEDMFKGVENDPIFTKLVEIFENNKNLHCDCERIYEELDISYKDPKQTYEEHCKANEQNDLELDSESKSNNLQPGKGNKTISNFKHIGLGNPNSKVLIVGKELAIDVNGNLSANGIKNWTCPMPYTDYYKRLYINEVLLNYYLWAIKVKKGYIFTNLCHFQDPEFPPSFCHLYNKEKTLNHTWGVINKMFSYRLSSAFNFNATLHSDSFFQHCFLTELYLNPSKRSTSMTKEKVASITSRFDEIINDPFYRDFDTIIFACATYLGTIDDYSKKLCDQYKVNKIEMFNNTCNIKECYLGDKKIIITSQISDLARWCDKELQQIASMIQIFEKTFV